VRAARARGRPRAPGATHLGLAVPKALEHDLRLHHRDRVLLRLARIAHHHVPVGEIAHHARCLLDFTLADHSKVETFKSRST
jgi:hypothetical protein